MSAVIPSGLDNDTAPTSRSAAAILVRLDVAEAQTIRLNRALTIVGSKGHSHLRIMSKAISGSHALLLNLGNNVFLRDLMSRSHTYLNERRVIECRLKYGDVLRFGEMRFRFQDVDVVRHSLSAVRSPPAALLLDRATTPLVLGSPTFVIGRTKRADLHLEGNRVSRAHAILFEQNGGHFLRDLSRDGTRVDGKPVRSLRLQGGETIEIGGFQFRYQICPTTESFQAVSPTSQGEEPMEKSAVAPDGILVNEALVNEGDSTGEQYVFAPEPEILPNPFESKSDSPHMAIDAIDPEEDCDLARDEREVKNEEWEFDSAAPTGVMTADLDSGPAHSTAEQAQSAEDLIGWGITLNLGVAPQPDPPQATKSARNIPPTAAESHPEALGIKIISPAVPDGADRSHPVEPVLRNQWGVWQADSESHQEVRTQSLKASSSLESAAPALSEPIDLAALAPLSPPAAATLQMQESTERESVPDSPSVSPPPRPADNLQNQSVEEADENTIIEGCIATQPEVISETHPVAPRAFLIRSESNVTSSPQGTGLLSVDDIVSQEVLQLKPSQIDDNARRRHPASRLVWIAAAGVLLLGTAVATWMRFGQQLKTLLVH